MSKYVQFTVELEFSDKIVSDNEILEIAQNVANALENEANTKGLAPEQGDAFTVAVRVTPQYINTPIHVDIFKPEEQNTLIGVVDVRTVADSIKQQLTDAEVSEIISLYQEADPSATWVLVVEQLIYQLKS